MPISETARHDLYNGLTDLLGPDQAETLMAYLPEFDPSDVATKSDIARLDTDITAVHLELKEFRAEMARGFAVVNDRFDRVDDRFGRVDDRFGRVDNRFDRLFLTLVAGLFVIVAAMAGVVFTAL